MDDRNYEEEYQEFLTRNPDWEINWQAVAEFNAEEWAMDQARGI